MEKENEVELSDDMCVCGWERFYHYCSPFAHSRSTEPCKKFQKVPPKLTKA